MRRNGPHPYDTILGSRAAWYAWKLVLGLAMVVVVSFVYFNAAQLTAHRSYDLGMPLDDAIPFVPWTWWIYFPGYLTGLLFAIFALRNTQGYYRILGAIFVACLLCSVGFLLLPSTYPRPTEAPVGLTGDAIRWFWSLDPPNNTFPSAHVSISVLAAISLWEERNRLWWVGALFALGVVITVHTTKQHYLIDTIGGIGVAATSFWLVCRWAPARRAERREALPSRAA